MKKYIEIYNQIKEMIITGQYKSGDRIPSVRAAAQLFGVSTTTIKNAYFDLCADGYIVAQEKSGFYVGSITSATEAVTEIKEEQRFFNLIGGEADPECFDIALWQRYIKSALRQGERLLSYSEVQGEYDLRCAISDYIRVKRNVTASPDRIIIGAGVQPLLHILSSLLDKSSTISFPDNSFIKGISLFRDNGFNVHTRDKDADVIYVCPSHMTRWGDVMPIKRRLELVEYSINNSSVVIEDDYENDFMYNIKPTPSLYALGKGNVIYIGSFSAMLLPGIRISFMVLTEELTDRFKEVSYKFSQTASKTEQIALCQYIRDGHINSQIRKIRRIYSAKAKEYTGLLQRHFPDADIKIGENKLQIIFTCKFSGDITVFEENGIRVFIEKYEEGLITLIISPSGIANNQLEDSVILLKKAIEY